MSAADEIAPARNPMVPTSSFGSQCRPTMLLGGLEDEPHRAGKLVPVMGEVQGGAEHDGGVDVVAARVRHARHLAAVGDVLLVGHGECVEVCSQRQSVLETGGRTGREDVAHETGADGEAAGLEPRELEAFVDEIGGGPFGTAQLGVRVEVAAQRDETLAVLVEPSIDRSWDGGSGRSRHSCHRVGRPGGRTPVIVSVASSAARCWTTSASVPPASTTRR